MFRATIVNSDGVLVDELGPFSTLTALVEAIMNGPHELFYGDNITITLREE